MIKKNDYLYRKGWFRLLLIIPFGFLIWIVAFKKRSERLKRDVRLARRIRASKNARRGIKKVKAIIKEGSAEKFYYEVFKTMQDYLGNKFHLPSAGITADTAEQTLSSKGVNEELIKEVKSVFADCDTARYAPSEMGKEAMLKTLEKFVDAIEKIERVRV